MKVCVLCIICIWSMWAYGNTGNAGFREIIDSTRLESLKEVVASQKEDSLLEKQCELELSSLYPPVSCLRRMDRQRIRKKGFCSVKRAKYQNLCLRRVRYIKDPMWIQKAIAQKPGSLCEKALARQKEILDYRNSKLKELK